MPPKNKLQDHSADNVGPTREKTLNQLISKSDEALKFKVETSEREQIQTAFPNTCQEVGQQFFESVIELLFLA